MAMLFGIIYEISPVLFDKILSALGFTDGLGFMWIFGGVTVLLMFIAFYVYNKWM